MLKRVEDLQDLTELNEYQLIDQLNRLKDEKGAAVLLIDVEDNDFESYGFEKFDFLTLDETVDLYTNQEKFDEYRSVYNLPNIQTMFDFILSKEYSKLNLLLTQKIYN